MLHGSMAQRMQCYIPGGPGNEPFKYNPDLNAGPQYTPLYHGPDYKIGGIQLDDVSVFMGVEPTSQAAEYFASNKPKNFSLSWAESTEAQLKSKLLGCNAAQWSEETQTVMGKKKKVAVSLFNVPQGSLPAKYNGDLKNWEFGPTTDLLNLDFSKGINGEVGMITVGNTKGGGIPDIDRSNWNDNVQIVWDEELGKYVCQLDTYMIYKDKVADIGKAWVTKNTGGLITTRMYASGRYEVRAKVPKAPGLVWAIWTFWGNEIWSDRQLGLRKDYASSTDYLPCCSNSPMWVDRNTELGRLLPQPGKEFPNHEIDIEIPSNAPQTVAPKTPRKDNKYDTMNMNCYRWTNSDGTGTYCNLFCHKKTAPFVGDGKYHTYRFDWHTGSTDTAPRVDFYFDDAYIGTNDAFVPYMAGRLWIMLWAPSNGQPGGSGVWNGVVDQSFHQPSRTGEVAHYARVLVDYVRITPFNEPNDHYAPSAFDQPCMGTQPGCVDCGRHNPDPKCGTTSILPYTTATETGCGGIKWVKKVTS